MSSEALPNSRAPSLRGHYPASSLPRARPPPSRRQPISRGHRLYGLPCSADFAAGRGGLLQWLLHVSGSPCRRSHPAGGESPRQPDCDAPCCLRADRTRSASGAWRFRGYLCVHSGYGPATRSPSFRWLRRWAPGVRFPSALPSKLRDVWLLSPWVYLPLNTSAFGSHPVLRQNPVRRLARDHRRIRGPRPEPGLRQGDRRPQTAGPIRIRDGSARAGRRRWTGHARSAVQKTEDAELYAAWRM